MCVISTEDALTCLAAEDTCKFHTLSKHENYLRDDFDDKKSEKGWKLFLKGKTLLIYYKIQWKNLWDNNRDQNNLKIIDMTLLMKIYMKRLKHRNTVINYWIKVKILCDLLIYSGVPFILLKIEIMYW